VIDEILPAKATVTAPALPTNIRIGWKSFPRINTPTIYEKRKCDVKGF
jgi:hypothetical protein